MAERLGIAINPHILALLFRIGAVIRGQNGFAVRLVEDGLPDDYILLDCDYNRHCGQFWMVFCQKSDPAPGPIRWLTPLYDKEYDDGADQKKP